MTGERAIAENITAADILEMLAVVLIEMRVHESPSYPKIMADVFHHVPRMLRYDRDPTEIYADIQKLAARHGVEDYIEMLARRCKDSG